MLKVTCALIVNNKKILITQNGQYSDHPYEWEFPGGKINSGESAEECIVREIKEELDIKITIQQALKPIVFDYGIKEIELIPFICTVHSGKIKLNEHIGYKWIGYDDLKHINFSGADTKLILEKENRLILKEYIGKQMNKA